MTHKTQQSASSHQKESLNLAEVLHILTLRRKMIALLTLFIVMGVALKHIFYVPIYHASTELLIQRAEQNSMQVALSSIMGSGGVESNDRIFRYLNYIRSSDFYIAVAETLKYSDHYDQLKLTSPGEMAVTEKKFWLHFFATRFGRKFHVTDGSDAIPTEPVLIPVEKLAGLLQNLISARQTDRDTVSLNVSTLDPFTSMVLANVTAEVFVRKTTERDYNEVTQLKGFIEEQLATTTEHLKAAELGLVEFNKRNNIISIASEQAAFSKRLTRIESDLETSRIQFRQNAELIRFYERTLAEMEKNLLSQGSAGVRGSPGQVVEQLRAQLDNLRRKKVYMQAQGYAQDSADMLRIDANIDSTTQILKTELKRAGLPETALHEVQAYSSPEDVRNKLRSLKASNRELETRISTIGTSRDELLKKLERLPKEEQELIKLTRDVNLQFELYSTLKKKLQEVQIQQVALQSHLMISKRATLPPPEPRAKLILKLIFAMFAGLFVGTVISLMLEAVDPTVKYRSDLEDQELIPLGSIPRSEGSPVRRINTGYRRHMLICKDMPESPESMAFKHIRAQLLHMKGHAGKPGKAICVTSPEQGDGKSFTSANLAVSFAQLEKKTVLIDCDFRYPSVPEFFALDRRAGLTSLLTLKATIDDVMIRGWMPNLDILPAGFIPKNPTELISNDKFRILLDHLESIYDYIVIDCPPAVAVVDAAVIASLSDVVIVATSYRKTRKDSLSLAVKKILQITHKHLYSVLNNVWEAHEYAQYSYYTMNPERQNPIPAEQDSADLKEELLRFESSLKRKTG